MMIDMDITRYTKLPRTDALAILERAKMEPDDFTAHRDGTFTARYLRDRTDTLETLGYESRIEAADPRVAIFKRPSNALDRGRYVTLKFAVVCADKLGIEPEKAKPQPKPDEKILKPRDQNVLKLLRRVADNMQNLTAYAQDLVKDYPKHDHMEAILEELDTQIEIMRDGLEHIGE